MVSALEVLVAASKKAGVQCASPALLRAGENTLFVLPEQVVARVTRSGQEAVARKEVLVSRWLRSLDFPVVETINIEQPVVVGDRAVTYWKQLPAHRPGTPAEVGAMLQRLHALALPETLQLPLLDPLTRLAERISGSSVLEPPDRDWLRMCVNRLADMWQHIPVGRPWCAVHGDAWGSNFVATKHQVVMLDLERFAYGPPEWDLTAIAVDYETFSAMSGTEWLAVCESYGYNVTDWSGYQILRDIRELRKVTFAFQAAENVPLALNQAVFRLSCIRGEQGPRPWNWVGVV